MTTMKTAISAERGEGRVSHSPDSPNWLSVAELLLVQVMALLVLGLITPAVRLADAHADMTLYAELASSVVAGAVPYVDLPIEYPPLALVPIIGAQLLPSPADVDLESYVWRFLVINALIASAMGLLVVGISVSSRVLGGPARALASYLPFAVVLSPLIAWRYDVWPAFLSLAALALLLSNRTIAAGVALAASILAKLYALPLVVLFAAWHIGARNYRDAAILVGTVAALCAATLGIFALPGVTPTFFWFQLGRGIQVESLPAGIIGLARLAGLDASVEYSFGAHQLASPWSAGAAVISQAAAVLLVGVILVLAALRFRGRKPSAAGGVAELAAYGVAIVLAVVVTNKALSPQYLVWLLPFVPFLPGGPRLLLLGSALLTLVIFPFLYHSLLRGEALPVVILNLRNAALIAALAWVLVRFAPRRSQQALASSESAGDDQ
jgi:hypothetical protein